MPIRHNYYNATKAELLMLSDSDNESVTGSVKNVPITTDYTNNPYNISNNRLPLPLQITTSAYQMRHKEEEESKETKNPALGFDFTKKSSAVLTTTSYEERVNILNALSTKSQYISPMLPMAAYCGKKLDPKKDPYNRRKVKQLDDISFESDDEPEEIKNLRRLPETVLTEESLKDSLSRDLRKLNLDNHFWIKNNFIDKIGRMAPNLVEISLRGLKITSQSFSDLVKHLGLLKIIDISNCRLLEEDAILSLAETNTAIVQFKCSGCRRAITDTSFSALINASKCQYEILDLSY